MEGKKTEEYEAFFEAYDGDMVVVRRILGRKRLVSEPIGSVYESISGANATKTTGRRLKLQDLPQSTQKKIKESAEHKAGANVKALKQEIQSLKDALKSQKATQENVMNAKVSSLVRRHEREMASVKQDHKSERERMDLALSCTNKKNLRQENIIRHLEEG